MAKELSEEDREAVQEMGRTLAQGFAEEGAPLWQVREVLVAAFDAEAARIATESGAIAPMHAAGLSD